MYYNCISTFRHNQGYAEKSGSKLPHSETKNRFVTFESLYSKTNMSKFDAVDLEPFLL